MGFNSEFKGLKVDVVMERYEIKKLSRRICKGRHTNQCGLNDSQVADNSSVGF